MESLSKEKLDFLQKKAKDIRIEIIKEITNANSGHPGGSLSIADLLTLLFFHEMHVDIKNPKMENRDRLVLSKGHGAPALYAVLAEKGFFDKQELNYLRQVDHILQVPRLREPQKLSIPHDQYERPVPYRKRH